MEADRKGEKAVAVTWERKPAGNSIATHPGVYCLRTNVTDWDAQRLWSTYVLLTNLEAVFRSLKTELGLRPIYHWKPLRSDVDDAIWLVSFMHCDLGYIDLEQKTLQTIDNPFGARL